MKRLLAAPQPGVGTAGYGHSDPREGSLPSLPLLQPSPLPRTLCSRG